MLADRHNGSTLDEAAEKAGGYVDYVPGRPLIMDYDYRAMSNYAHKKGVRSIDLTAEEKKMFEFDEPLVYKR